MKNCSRCSKNKNLNEFSNLSKSKDGKNYICKECDAKAKLLNKKDKYTDEQIKNYISEKRILNKICITCNLNKELQEFTKDYRLKDGVANNCKSCCAIRKNKEKQLKIEKQQKSNKIDSISSEDVLKLQELFNKGKSIRRIAKSLNISKDKVKEVLKILNLKASSRSRKGTFNPLNYDPISDIEEAIDGDYFIYVIINKINKKIYVGQTVDLKHRWLKHVSVSRDETNNLPLYNSMRKYGIDNFSIEIIDQLSSLKACNEAEIYWVDYLNTLDLSNGYNILPGGRGRIYSEEEKLAMSERMKGENNPFFKKKT